MMRSNASIPALLALAGLSLLPAIGLAKPTHRTARKAAPAASAKQHAHQKLAAEPLHEVRSIHRHTPATGRPTHPTASRIAERQPAERHTRHAEERTETRIAAHTTKRRRQRLERVSTPTRNPVEAEPEPIAETHHQATSDDFLKAASTPPAIPAAIAIHGTARPDEPAPTPPPTQRHTSSVAKPVPVVSVIRPTAEKPQLASIEEAASTPVILPELYNKRGRLIVPPPLKGSHEILIHQNEVADRDGLHRIQDDDDLLDMRSKRLLVALPENGTLQVDDRLPTNRRFCRPWTAQFLATLARAHYAHFHTPLQVNSAVRTVEFQQHLIHINGNAAPAEGDTASPHLTGQAIDIAKHGLSLSEIAWMRGYLLPLVQEGKVDVEEEFQQSCFHISVYKRYVPSDAGPERELAVAHHGGTSALATALR
ncbi:DUF5715 family protein [Granulicella sp. L60]|uniref:DUF5715 family protein n=1 Tax=Granulicella sp. L60 TaxID=1641866 RepID=UPI00131B257C|nr:DUF5715 family protein [Granulicella sp. L60]